MAGSTSKRYPPELRESCSLQRDLGVHGKGRATPAVRIVGQGTDARTPLMEGDEESAEVARQSDVVGRVVDRGRLARKPCVDRPRKVEAAPRASLGRRPGNRQSQVLRQSREPTSLLRHRRGVLRCRRQPHEQVVPQAKSPVVVALHGHCRYGQTVPSGELFSQEIVDKIPVDWT